MFCRCLAWSVASHKGWTSTTNGRKQENEEDTSKENVLWIIDANNDRRCDNPITHTDSDTTNQSIENEQSTSYISLFEDNIVEGDPYTVENMRKALSLLFEVKTDNRMPKMTTNDITENLEANYLYVRFLYKGPEQKTKVRRQKIVLFDHPMDYKDENRYKDYVDTSLPDSVEAYYGAVPTDYQFDTEIEYEELKQLFLIQPILSRLDSLSESGVNDIFRKAAKTTKQQALLSAMDTLNVSLVDLEMAARYITDNISNDDKTMFLNNLSEKKTLGKVAWWWSKWRPSGTLKYSDTELSTKPIKGLRVTAGYFYYWRSSTTNSSGYFRSPERWRWKVRYKAHWDADDFNMEDGDSWYGADLVYVGPKKRSAWNKTFTGKHAAYAAIFVAAQNYYYEDIDGLNRPHQNGWFSLDLDLKVYNSYDASMLGKMIAYPFNPTVKIFLKDSVGNYRDTDEIYGTTTHELTHNAHYENFETRYFWLPRLAEFGLMYLEDTLFVESYACGIQWYLTEQRYAGYQRPYFHNYTGIVEDLIDTDTHYAGRSITGDYVNGFTINQIEAAAMVSFTWEEFEDNLVELYPSSTSGPSYSDDDMSDLFEYWEDE